MRPLPTPSLPQASMQTLAPPPPFAGAGGCAPITNQQCQALASQFTTALQPYGGAALVLPQIGLPEQNALFPGVCTIAHTVGPATNARVEGFVSRSPLANVALYSTECAQPAPGTSRPAAWLNFYEAMVPDTPRQPQLLGSASQQTSAEIYANTLSRSGLSTAGNHYHWYGMEPWMAAIHHQQFGMPPSQFVDLTTRAYAAAVPPSTSH